MHLSDQFRTMLLLLTKKKTNHRTPPGVLQDTVFDFLIGREDILSLLRSIDHLTQIPIRQEWYVRRSSVQPERPGPGEGPSSRGPRPVRSFSSHNILCFLFWRTNGFNSCLLRVWSKYDTKSLFLSLFWRTFERRAGGMRKKASPVIFEI